MSVYPDHAVIKPYRSEMVKVPYTGMKKAYPEYSGFYVYEAQITLETGANVAAMSAEGSLLPLVSQEVSGFMLNKDCIKRSMKDRIK